MRNLKLTIAYDGSAYHGFQEQRDDRLPTIQGQLRRAWMELTGETVKIIGSGRTDAGVHADGQVVNFRTNHRSIPAKRVPYALNTVLPWDIRVVDCEEVPWDFHAQYDAVAKMYVYRMLNRKFPLPRLRHDTYFVPQPLDLHAMKQGASILVGRHDFRAFTSEKELSGSTVRYLMRCDVERAGDVVQIVTVGDGFLYHMVRTIAGTLLKVGDGTFPPEWVGEVLESRDRTRAGKTLPGHGLVLKWVAYDQPFDPHSFNEP